MLVGCLNGKVVNWYDYTAVVFFFPSMIWATLLLVTSIIAPVDRSQEGTPRVSVVLFNDAYNGSD